MREIEEEWSGFMHEHEFPIKALTCTGKTTPQGLSDYGFINTTNILQESKERTNSRSDTVEENSGKDNNDVPLYSSTPKSVGQTRNLLKKKVDVLNCRYFYARESHKDIRMDNCEVKMRDMQNHKKNII